MSTRRLLIEALNEAFPGGARTAVDADVVDRMVELLAPVSHPQIETVMVGGTGGGFRSVGVGPDGLRAAWGDWLEGFERIEIEVEDVTLFERAVLVLVRQIGTTRHDSVQLEQPSAAAYLFEGEQLRRIEFHLDRDAAAASARAGLAETGSHSSQA